MNSFSMKAKCWTPEDRYAAQDIIDYCQSNNIGLSLMRNETHALFTFQGVGEAFDKLLNYVKEKYDERPKV